LIELRSIERGKTFNIVIEVHFQPEAYLMEVVQALGELGGLPGLRQCGQQQTGENPDDHDHEQEFDESEGAITEQGRFHRMVVIFRFIELLVFQAPSACFSPHRPKAFSAAELRHEF
jgi:hypothetical protein